MTINTSRLFWLLGASVIAFGVRLGIVCLPIINHPFSLPGEHEEEPAR